MWPRLALAAAVATTLVGCTGGAAGTAARPNDVPAPVTVTQSGVSNGLAAIASTYKLVAVDGHVLPFAAQRAKGSDTPLTEIISGTLNVERDGTFALLTTYRAMEVSGQRTLDGKFTGVCAPAGDGFRLFWEGGGETALTMKGDTVTLNNNGVIYRYLRRR